jgi:hypothetical protein
MKPVHLVPAGAPVIAGTVKAVFMIHFAELSRRPRWARADVAVYKIVTYPSVLTWIWTAVVNVLLAMSTLVSYATFTRIAVVEVVAGGSVFAWIRFALVHVMFAIGTLETGIAMAYMGAAVVATASFVVTETRHSYTFPSRRFLTRNSLNVAKSARPALLTLALVSVPMLMTFTAVLARRPATPVHKAVTLTPSIAIAALAGIVRVVVYASTSVLTRGRLAVICLPLTIASTEAGLTFASIVVFAVFTNAPIET